jgi:hypothetical protein
VANSKFCAYCGNAVADEYSSNQGIEAKRSNGLNPNQFTPTHEMRDAVRWALNWKEKNRATGSEFNDGWVLASEILSKKPISLSQVRSLFSFLDRVEPGSLGYVKRNPTEENIMCWARGGSAGLDWSRQIIERSEFEARRIELGTKQKALELLSKHGKENLEFRVNQTEEEKAQVFYAIFGDFSLPAIDDPRLKRYSHSFTFKTTSKVAFSSQHRNEIEETILWEIYPDRGDENLYGSKVWYTPDFLGSNPDISFSGPLQISEYKLNDAKADDYEANYVKSNMDEFPGCDSLAIIRSEAHFDWEYLALPGLTLDIWEKYVSTFHCGVTQNWYESDSGEYSYAKFARVVSLGRETGVFNELLQELSD